MTETEKEEVVTLKHEQRGPVLVLTIDRQQVRNAVDATTARALNGAIRDAEVDPTVSAIILTGAGDRAFCSGLDLRDCSTDGPDVVVPQVLTEGGFCGVTERAVTKLFIAAVNGAAIAGGWELALSADLIVAAETAYFASNEVSRGMIADGGGCLRLPRILGRYRALELLLTGDRISAHRAEQLGLVNHVVPADEVLPAAIRLAKRVLRHSPGAISATRELVNATGGMPTLDDWTMNAKLGGGTLPTHDALEGSQAYVEKREPVWSD